MPIKINFIRRLQKHVPTIPNLLTLFRIILIPIMVGAFYAENMMGAWVATVCFIIACITDYLDGFVARLLSQTSKLGQFLDPTADKLLVASTLLLLVGFGHIEKGSFIPAIIILCREILVSGLREILLELSISMPVTRLAKWKTAFQMVALSMLMLAYAISKTGGELALYHAMIYQLGDISLWCAGIMTLVTGCTYLRAGLKNF